MLICVNNGRTLSKTLEKWYTELVKTRKAQKAAKLWKNRSMGRAWKQWELMLIEKKRLRSVGNKVVGRWKHRVRDLSCMSLNCEDACDTEWMDIGRS